MDIFARHGDLSCTGYHSCGGINDNERTGPTQRYTEKQLIGILRPFFAIDRSELVVAAIGPSRLTRLFSRLRISKLSRVDFRALLKLITIHARDESAIFLLNMDDWRRAVVRFSLESIHPTREWISILKEPSDKLLDTPARLPELSFPEIMRVSDRATSPQSAIRLCQGSVWRVAPNLKSRPDTLRNERQRAGPVDTGGAGGDSIHEKTIKSAADWAFPNPLIYGGSLIRWGILRLGVSISGKSRLSSIRGHRRISCDRHNYRSERPRRVYRDGSLIVTFFDTPPSHQHQNELARGRDLQTGKVAHPVHRPLGEGISTAQHTDELER